MAEHELIQTRATTHSGLSALIGNRFSPGYLPQGESVPAVTYRRITKPTSRTEQRDTSFQRYQFDCWADSYITANAVADQVEAAFELYGASGTPDLRSGWRIMRLDRYDAERRKWRVIVDLILVFMAA